MPHLSVDERLAKLEAVDLDMVRSVANDTYGAPTRVLGAVGPFEAHDLDGYLAV
jgi:hypothetical protein